MVYEYGLSEIVNFGMDVFDAVVHTCILRMQKGRTITQIGIKKNISDTNEFETIDKLSTKNDRIFLNIEELYFTSLYCDAVITIIPDINSNYKIYSDNNEQLGKLMKNGFTIFQKVVKLWKKIVH